MPPDTIDRTRPNLSTKVTGDSGSKPLEELAQLMAAFTVNQSTANDNINSNLNQLAKTLQQAVQGIHHPPRSPPVTPAGPPVPPNEGWFAVAIGRTPGVYNSMEALFKQITGFKDAYYESFATKDAAEAWLVKELAELEGIPALRPRRDRGSRKTKRSKRKKKAERKKRKKNRSQDSSSESSCDSSDTESSGDDEVEQGAHDRKRSSITGSAKLGGGEDPSKGEPSKVYGKSIYTGSAVKLLSPPHSSAETREDLMEAVPDVGSLPGKLIGAASELNDQVANSIQMIAEHAAQKNNVILKDTQFRYHSKNTLSKISSLESLVELADEFNEHMDKVPEAAKQAIAEILRNACWPEGPIVIYLESGGVVRLIERSMQYWLQLLLHLKNLHKPNEDWNDRVQIHVDYHSKQLALIRKYAANRSQMVLRVCTRIYVMKPRTASRVSRFSIRSPTISRHVY
jgi:uncharacterized phage infection (PIP) family protein YhgE